MSVFSTSTILNTAAAGGEPMNATTFITVPRDAVPRDAVPPSLATSIAHVHFSDGDTAWVLACTALVCLMIPGLGYFYSGMARSKNALSLIFLTLLSLSIVSIQWFLFGYSLAFSPTGGPFIGDGANLLLLNVGLAPHPNAPTVPESVFVIFQCMFAAITPALAFGAAAERARILPGMLFIFLWSTLVYTPLAYWVWAPHGWARAMGVYDYAGGSCIEISSGFAALAYAFKIGPRQGFSHQSGSFKPHSYNSIMLGTALLWFGWLGFNGGSAAGASARSGLAVLNTNFAGAAGGLAWLILSYRHQRTWSSFHFCSGAIAGMVAITPACGFVPAWAAVVIGLITGFVCHFAVEYKHWWRCDDALDVFGVHGIGGVVGMILTGVFATPAVAALDGQVLLGGAIAGNPRQIGIQLASAAAAAGWSFVLTFIILTVFDLVPFLRIRMNESEEIMGMDASQMGEGGYEHLVMDVAEELARRARVDDRGRLSFWGAIPAGHAPLIKEAMVSRSQFSLQGLINDEKGSMRVLGELDRLAKEAMVENGPVRQVITVKRRASHN